MDARTLLLDIKRANRAVLVVGLGISGLESLALLERTGIRRRAVDRTSLAEYQRKGEFFARLEGLRKNGAEIHLGVDGERIAEYLDSVGLAVLSPGVSHESAIYAALHRREVPMISELELGIQLHRCPAAVVTGSNGKSTTVSLLHHILEVAGKRSFLCGNVGVPVVSDLPDTCIENAPSSAECLVVEASSYQLESCHVIKPSVGIFLNLSENHLERHGTMQRYFDAKARMLLQQDERDTAVLNYDDPWTRGVAGRVKSKVLWFGREDLAAKKLSGVQIKYDQAKGEDMLIASIAGATESYSLRDSRLKGLHNRYNAAAVICAARSLGIDAATIQSGLISFVPLEHRIEPVVRPSGLAVVINDSKSTTVASAVAGARCIFEEFPGRPVTLLLGGLAKAGSWEPLTSLLEQHRLALRQVVCFGKDARIIASSLAVKEIPHEVLGPLRDATPVVLRRASANEVVVLSPGCASFDEFSDFEERGRRFKDFVRNFDAGQTLSSGPSIQPAA